MIGLMVVEIAGKKQWRNCSFQALREEVFTLSINSRKQNG